MTRTRHRRWDKSVGQSVRTEDTNAMKILYIALLASLLTAPLQSQQGRLCKGNPDLVGECFKLHGRVRIVNGAGMVIWHIGTDRILGVGDVEVCPLTKSKAGEMQVVCVASASHLVVRENTH